MRKNTNLTKYFPMIRAREDIFHEIQESPSLKKKFEEWDEGEQKRFLDMCTGERGIKILYDAYFKEIMNPEYAPDRLSALLSVLLDREVQVVEVLPAESRIADEESLLVMDILVKTTEGILLNCEVQKTGYKFMGERASCYSADLLLRQYKRIREQSTREKFSYRNIKDVYTIIFFEKSTEVFHAFYENGNLNVDVNEKENESGNRTKGIAPKANRKALIHRMKQQSDTGIQIELLQKYIFIPLDIFNKIYQNKPIDTKLTAWLTFLSTDQPERIAELIEGYPEFRSLYEDLYNMCRNVESVMDMYSRELAELDKNTVHLMIDEYREENEKNKQIIARMGERLTEKDKELSEKDKELTEKDKELTEKDKELTEKDRRIKELTAMLKEKNAKKCRVIF